jgi:hypothetical protein
VIILGFISHSCKEEIGQAKFIPDDIHQKQVNSLLEYGERIDLQKNPTLFVEFIDSSSQFLKQTKGNFEIRKSLIYYLSEQLESVGLIDESINITTSGLNDNTVTFADDSIYNTRALYGVLANLHQKAGNLDSVFYYEHLSYQVVKKHRNPFEIASPLNNIGVHHLDNGNLDSAMHYFDTCIIILDTYPPNTQYWDFFRCSVNDNIATILEINNRYDQAAPLYLKNYQWYWRDRHQSKNHNAGISLANALIEIEALDSAISILDNIAAKMDTSDYNEILINSIYLNATYSKYFLHIQDTSLANKYAATTALMEKNIISEDRNTEYLFNKKLKLYAKEMSRQKIILQKSQNAELAKTNNLQLVILLFIVITIGMAFWVFYSRSIANHRKLEMQAEIAEQQTKKEKSEKKLLDIELEYKKKDLVSVLLNLKQKDKWAQALNEQMKSVKTTVGHKRRNELNKLHNQIRFHLQTTKETDLHTNNLDLLDTEFHNNLLKKHPNLTKSEQQLFSLIKIRLNSHQIAQIKNVELASIKTLRYRLKQKLKLKASDDLDKFIHHF